MIGTYELNKVREQICDHYCKFPDEVMVIKDPDVRVQMMDRFCMTCPFNTIETEITKHLSIPMNTLYGRHIKNERLCNKKEKPETK